MRRDWLRINRENRRRELKKKGWLLGKLLLMVLLMAVGAYIAWDNHKSYIDACLSVDGTPYVKYGKYDCLGGE